MTTRTQHAPTFVKHPACPEWGIGYLVEERDEKRFYDFEDGKNHPIAKAYWSKLEPVEIAKGEANALEAKIRKVCDRPSANRKPRARAVARSYADFDAQVARFLELFPGGFAGETFVREERGEEAAAPPSEKKTKVKPLRGSAIATAQEKLSKSEVQALVAKPEELMARVREVHAAAGGLLHPLGDLIPFAKMPPERFAPFATALSDLLYGEGEYAPRFDRFVAVLAEDKLATWPLATVLSALVAPQDHVFVKPSYFEKQAAVVSFDLGYERVPGSACYGRLLGLARKVDEELRKRSLEPRDLLDVYSFISRTCSTAKAPKSKAPAAAAAGVAH